MSLTTTLPFGRKSRDGKSREAAVHLYKSDLPPRDFWAKAKVVARLNSIRAKHYSLGESSKRKNIIESAACLCGSDIQDIEHKLFEYQTYQTERRSLISKLQRYCAKEKISIPNTVIEIIKDPDNPPSKFLTEYLKKCKLKG